MKRIIYLSVILLMTKLSMATVVTGNVYSSSDSSIVFADVYYTNSSNGQVFSAFTQWGGYWLDLPEGTYNVLVDDIFNVYQDGNFGPIEVSGSTDLEINFVVDPIDFTNVDNSISGVIRDADTQLPLADANVEIRLDGNLALSMVTGIEGDYRFEDLLPRDYVLLVQADGYDFYTMEFSIGENTDLTQDVALERLTQENSVVVNGVVTSFYTGEPLADVTMVLQDALGNFNEEVLTGEDGRFEFPLVPDNSTYLLDASKNGYLFERFLLNTSGSDIEFNIDLTADVPENAGFIAGQVTFDDGAPVAGAIIEFLPLESSSYYSQGYTDANGNYTAELLPGAYIAQMYYLYQAPTVFAFITEYYNGVTDINEAEILTVTPGETTSGINFEITLPETYSTTISGRVTDDAGEPVSNAFVSLHNANPLYSDFFGNGAYAFTNDNGEYTMQASILSTNEGLKFSAEANNYLREFYNNKSTIFAADLITVNGDTAITGIDFSLTPYSAVDFYSVSGQVLEEGTDEPILSSLVLIMGGNGYFNITGVDSFGYYMFPEVPNGDYYMQFVSANHIPEYFDNAQSWEEATVLNLDTDLFNIDARLELFNPGNQAGNISGITRNDEGEVLAGVTVMVMDDNEEMIGYAMSDEQGRYSLEGLGTGDFSVLATFVDHKSENASVSMDLSESLSAELDFALQTNVTSVADDVVEISGFSLEQNYPNPFNPSTTIEVKTGIAAKAELVIFNVAGQKVRTLFSGTISSGTSQFVWNGRNDAGAQLGSGVYFYQLRMNGKSETRSMLLVK
jgi:hypothetical protein